MGVERQPSGRFFCLPINKVHYSILAPFTGDQTEDIRLGNDANEVSRLVYNGQSAELVVQHAPRGLADAGILPDGHRMTSHDFRDF